MCTDKPNIHCTLVEKYHGNQSIIVLFDIEYISAVMSTIGRHLTTYTICLMVSFLLHRPLLRRGDGCFFIVLQHMRFPHRNPSLSNRYGLICRSSIYGRIIHAFDLCDAGAVHAAVVGLDFVFIDMAPFWQVIKKVIG